MAVKPNDSRGTRIMTGLVPALYDTVNVAYPNATTEVYEFFYDGTSIATVTLVYDVNNNLVSATRTA